MGEYLFIGSAVLSILNGAVILSLNPRRAVNIAFLVSSFWVALWASCVALAIREGASSNFDPNRLILYLRLSSLVATFLGWSAWLTRNALLYEGASPLEIFRRSLPFLLICSFEAGLAMTEWYIPSDNSRTNHHRGFGYVIYNIVAVIACSWMLIDGYRHSKQLKGTRKIEMQFFVVCLVGACLLLLVSNITGSVRRLAWLRQTTPFWFVMLHVSAVWALSYYKIFDAKHVLMSVGQRLVLFAILAFCGVGLSLILGQFMGHIPALFLSSIVGCTLVILCDGPTRRILGLDRDRLSLKPRQAIIEWARRYPEHDKLEIRFEELLKEWCQTGDVWLLAARRGSFSNAELSISNDWSGLTMVLREGWITPEALQRRRTASGTQECMTFMKRHNLGAILSVPRSSMSPSLIVVFGQKHNLRPYTFPDIQVLLELVELMDNILTHCRVAAHSARIEKMESAALMSRGLAHDLNNLATPVSTFLVHMESRVMVGTLEAEVLADAKHSIGVMRNYIRESLFFGRSLIPSYDRVDAQELLSSVARSCHDRARTRGVHVLVENFENFALTADPALIHRLLQNLAFNGIDASPIDGSVTLYAVPSGNGQAVFKVTDHGSGLDPRVSDRIFEPYFTTKNTEGESRGLGLGLAICQKIADLHGGKITACCDSQEGTVFTLILPTTPRRETVTDDHSRLAPSLLNSEATNLQPAKTSA